MLFFIPYSCALLFVHGALHICARCIEIHVVYNLSPGQNTPPHHTHTHTIQQGPPGSFSAAGVCNPQLVRDLDSKMFVMFYEGIAEDGSRSIGMATSQDGMQTWDTYPQYDDCGVVMRMVEGWCMM